MSFQQKNITVSLKREENLLQMDIENDFGFHEKTEKSGKGIGIDIMKYRANLINANLEFNRNSGKYTVSLTVKNAKGSNTKTVPGYNYSEKVSENINELINELIPKLKIGFLNLEF